MKKISILFLALFSTGIVSSVFAQASGTKLNPTKAATIQLNRNKDWAIQRNISLVPYLGNLSVLVDVQDYNCDTCPENKSCGQLCQNSIDASHLTIDKTAQALGTLYSLLDQYRCASAFPEPVQYSVFRWDSAPKAKIGAYSSLVSCLVDPTQQAGVQATRNQDVTESCFDIDCNMRWSKPVSPPDQDFIGNIVLPLAHPM